MLEKKNEKLAGMEMDELLENARKCFACESELCIFTPKGFCLYPLISGEKPGWDNDFGCYACRSKEA